MKRVGFLFTETAKQDFANLRAFWLKEATPQVARRQGALIAKCIRRLIDHPENAPCRDQRAK